MPTLDYAQSRPFSRRTINIIVAVVLLVVLIVICWNASEWFQQLQATYLANADHRLIDAEIPGTEVYFRDKLLGITPLTLSKADCEALGLPVAMGTLMESDGWGEGLTFHDPTTNSDPRLMYKVPSEQASAFLSYETPWGLRTKMGGGSGLPNRFKSKFMSRDQNGVGITVNINFNARPDPSETLLKLTVSATNSGSEAYTGFRPEVEVLWGTFDVQWQRRSHKTFALPAEWASIAPGKTLQTTVEIPLPANAGDYSVFATLNVFQNQNGNYLVGQGSIYSDSKLLRVP